MTELLKDAMNDGKDVITLHFTTEKVDVSGVNAIEFYSSREGEVAKVPVLTVDKKRGTPTEIDIIKKGENYLDHASLAQKIFRRKSNSGNLAGKYLKADKAQAALLLRRMKA